MSYIAYRSPVDDVRFVLQHVLKVESEVLGLTKFSSFSMEVVDAVLDEAGKFANEVLAPLNVVGDREMACFEAGNVTMPSGFKEAYHLFVQNGWNGLGFPETFSGQGLPFVVNTAVSEFWNGANMAFTLCPLLTQGAVELLLEHGDEVQQSTYLSQLVSGAWSGTMCLTEPQAGSDVGALTTQAIPCDDGTYYIKGTKIFITYGEHDLSENIIHLVLARLPGAPDGTKGISLFVVPKLLSDGTRNDVQCVSIEHKLGIHASPTAVLSFGEQEGAVGYLVGEPHQGMQLMFTMMNSARLAVGMEGLGIADAALQQAIAYAKERVQGVPIEQHPDVQRLLLSMRARVEAMRALLLYVAMQSDVARHADQAEICEAAQAIVDLLIPVVKGGATDMGFAVSSDAIQVFGGMGYIEETGVAQYLRDSRIAMIYEGTNGIQAMDLVLRKLVLQDGALFAAFDAEVSAFLKVHASEDAVIARFAEYYKEFVVAVSFVQQLVRDRKKDAGFVGYYMLRLFGLVAGGYLLIRSLVALDAIEDVMFVKNKRTVIDFYVSYELPEVSYLSTIIQNA